MGVIFAMLLGSGALLAVAALGLDFGRVYLEQQTLRNASSAAALALAQACANDSQACASQESATSFVQSYLNQNSPDSESAVHELCGSAPLEGCPATSDSPGDCNPYNGSLNLVRVTASSAESGTPGLRLFFTTQDRVELWQCAQAEWPVNILTPVSFQTQLDLGFPVCSHPGDNSPVVWFQFQSSSPSPAIPREASCVVEIDEELLEVNNYSNGMAGLDLRVGKCDKVANLVAGDVVKLGQTDLTRLCSRRITTFLDSAISSGREVRVALLGSFVRQDAKKIDFQIAGVTNVQIFGYVLSPTVQGGAVPPGGWASYPVEAPAGLKCGGLNPCIFGAYSSALDFGTYIHQARLTQ